MRAKLEAELQSAEAAKAHLEDEGRALEQRVRQLEASLAACAAERDRAAGRLRALPEALRTLQARLSDTLLRPLEETLRVELAPLPPTNSICAP